MKPAPKPVRKPKAKKRKKKTPRQIIIRDLDNLVRQIVFERDPYSAQLVYKEVLEENGITQYKINHSGIDHPGHIISRKRQSVRWDLRNVHRQDANDNLLHNYFPDVYITWFIRQFGLEQWRDLEADSIKTWKYSMDDLETLYIELIEISKRQKIAPFWKPYFSQKDIISGTWRK